jgi:hypothetical protein
MRLPGRPQTFFGIPRTLPRKEAQRLSEFLERAWEAQMGKPLGELDGDLEELKRFFNPIAQGRRLREALTSLPRIAGVRPDAKLLWLPVGDSRVVVTPEGRAALAWLTEALADHGDVVALGDSEAAGLEHRLVETYRRWSQQRLRQVAGLLAGEGPPMLPQAIAATLLLLVNRSTTYERAIVRPREARRQQLLDRALQTPVVAFAERLAPSTSRSPEHYSFYGGYTLTEARRRLGDKIVLRGDHVYVDGAQQAAVIEFLGRDLARRKGVTHHDVAIALDALVDAYQSVRPQLAAFGVAFERASDTLKLRRALGEEFTRSINEL